MTFKVVDENGCSFSKVLTVQVSDTLAEINDPEICELNREVQWPNTEGDLSFVSGPSSDITVTNSGNYFEVAVPETGDYTFEFNYNDCSNAPEAHLTFINPNDPACLTGIDEIGQLENFILAPNPVKTVANLSFDLQKAQTVHISISTVEGKVISTESLRFTGGSQTKEINMEKFEPGTYIITLKGTGLKLQKF